MDELDFKELFDIFWKKKYIVLAIMFFCTAIGTIYSFTTFKPEYKTYTTVLVKEEQTNKEESKEVNDSNIYTYAEIAKSNDVIDDVVKELNIDSINRFMLKENLEVKVISNTDIIKIQVINGNAENAATIANKIAEVFKNRLKEIYNLKDITILDKAEINNNPSNKNHEKNIIISTAIGVIISCTYIFILSTTKNKDVTT